MSPSWFRNENFRGRRRRILSAFASLATLSSLVVVGSTVPSQSLPLPSGGVKFEQWDRNDNQWVTGNLTNIYNEGETVPFRVDATGVDPGQYDLSICRGFTNNTGTVFGYLFLDQFDTTVAPVVGAGITSTMGPASGAATGDGADVAIDAVNEIGAQGSCNSPRERETVVTLTITGTPTAAYVLFGGHLAAQTDEGVGIGQGASGFPGSSLHMELETANKALPINVGPQTTGVVTVIKNAVPDSDQAFTFVPSEGINDGDEFTLVDDGDPSAPENTRSFTVDPDNSLTVRENPTVNDGYILTDITCTSTFAEDTSSGDVQAATATFVVEAGERVTCTFTNVEAQLQTGTLEVRKVLSPDTDSGTFNLAIDGTEFATGVGHGGTTGPQVVEAGTHTVSETAAGTTDLSNYTSTILCLDGNDVAVFPANGEPVQATSLADVPVDEGQEVICTITNTRGRGTIRVIKDVDPADDPGLFNLLVDGSVAAADVDTDGDVTVPVDAGLHTVGESAGTDTDLANYSTRIVCINPTGDNNGPLELVDVTGVTEVGDIPVPIEGSVECTITNTRNRGTLQVIKNLAPANDPGRFDLLIDGTAQATNVGNGGSTPVVVVNAGMHTVSELGNGTNLANYTSSVLCTHVVDDVVVELAGSNTSSAIVNVATGDEVTCTITNTRRPADPDPDPDPDYGYGTDPDTLPTEQPYEPVPGDQPAGEDNPGVETAGEAFPVTAAPGSGDEVVDAVLDAVEAPVTLPRTGGELIQQAVAGLGLVGLGLVLLAVYRRRPSPTSA